MPEDANAELVRDAYEALAEGGVEAIFDFVDPDFVVETPADLAVEPQVYRGHEGVRRWFETFYEVMDEVGLEADEIVPAGERVVVHGRVVARGQDSGIEVNQSVSLIWTIRDGKATRLDIYGERADALAAAGLER